MIINEVLGTKFKVVTSHLGTQETLLAMECGEANGHCILSLSALKTAKPDWPAEKKVNLLLQVGLMKSPELPGAPPLLDLGKTTMIATSPGFLSAPTAMARPFADPRRNFSRLRRFVIARWRYGARGPARHRHGHPA